MSLPRFKGCPEICEHANLPMFASEKEAEKFCSHGSLVKWFCQVCYHWHAWAKAPAPSGESSDSAREQTVPAHIAALVEEN